MKKFCAGILALLLLLMPACQSAPEKPYIEEQTVGPYIPDVRNEEIPFSLEHIYPLSELDPGLMRGPLSVDELIARYGEPEWLYVDAGHRWGFTIFVSFENISFTLHENPGVRGRRYKSEKYFEKRSVEVCWGFDDVYGLTEAGMDIRFDVYQTTVGLDIPITRGIRRGDSLEEVLVAYPGEPDDAQGEGNDYACLYYRYCGGEDEALLRKGELVYGDWYGLWYTFWEGRLGETRIIWYDRSKGVSP